MRDEKRVKYSTFFSSLARSLFSPFLTLYALSLGASNFQIGLISSLTSIVSIIAQLIGTSIAESVKRKILLYIIIDSIGYLFFIPISLVNNPNHLLILISLQTFFFSFPLQVWNELLVIIFPKWRRGREIGLINKIGSLGSLIAYVVAGYTIRKFGFIPYLFYTAICSGLLSDIVLLGMKEKTYNTREVLSSFKETFSFKILKEGEFRKFRDILIYLIRGVGANKVIEKLPFKTRLPEYVAEINRIKSVFAGKVLDETVHMILLNRRYQRERMMLLNVLYYRSIIVTFILGVTLSFLSHMAPLFSILTEFTLKNRIDFSINPSISYFSFTLGLFSSLIQNLIFGRRRTINASILYAIAFFIGSNITLPLPS